MVETKDLGTYADYQKYNFFRTPDWRWERVLKLVDRPGDIPGRCSRRDDHIVRAARAFIAKRRNGDEMSIERLKYDNPGLFYAYEFHQRAQEDPDAAMYIQARILARQTPEAIADIMGVLPDSVQWYCDLFFDVIPHLDKRDWITKQVIAPALVRTAGVKLPDDDVPHNMFKDNAIARPFMDGTLKLFAYYGGPYMADLLIGGLQAGKPVVNMDDIDNWLDRTVATTIKRRTAQAAQMFEINKYNVMELLSAHAQLMAIANSAENSDNAKSELDKHIRATINEIPWAAGEDGEQIYSDTVLGRFDTMASELRDDELILLASGRTAETVTPSNFPKALPAAKKDKKAIVASRKSEL